MLERLAAWFLNTYVADYVGNVDTDQLSIGLLKGAVELEKLPLKKDALRKLRLPFDVKSGYIGKLRLQIPVRSIKSAPWVIQIDQLYVVAGPAPPNTSTPEEEEERKQTKKESKLRKMEEQWRAEQQKSASWWYWSPISFTFPSNVIANLQVIVNDVHIRYEDTEADPAHPFSVGLLLENLSAQSTDEYWEPKFTVEGEKAWKLVDLQNLWVYFDQELLGDLDGRNILEVFARKRAEALSQRDPMTTSSMSGICPPLELVVRSVNGQAKLTRNSSKRPLKISDGPRFNLDVQLEEIPIVISDEQYALLVKLLQSVRMRTRTNRLRKWWRDEGGAGSGRGEERTARRLWKFALGVTVGDIRDRNSRCSRSFALKRARQNVSYVNGYMRHLTEVSLPEELGDMLKEVEREQSYEELLVLRKISMRKVEKERSLAEAAKKVSSATPQPGVLQSWFPGWYSSQTSTSSTASTEGGASEEGGANKLSEEDVILNELGYEEMDNMVFRDRIFLTLNIFLVGGSFLLVTTPSPETAMAFFGPEPLVEATFAALSFSLDLRPRLRYCSLDVSLGSLSLLDHSDSNCLFPILVQPRQSKQKECQELPGEGREDALFAFKMMAEEVQHQRLYQFKVHSRPLDVVFKPSLVTQIRQILIQPLVDQGPTSLGRGSNASASTLGAFNQGQASSTLSDKLGQLLGGGAKTSSHRILSVKMDISAPCFILPRTFIGQETSMVVLDLGHVTFSNVSDWSTDETDLGEEPVGLEIGEDDDDEFQTPPSSPTVEEAEECGAGISSLVSQSASLQGALHSLSALQRLQLPHEKYLLCLTDLQVSVGKVEESEGNWSPPTSTTHNQHLINSFSLSVKMRRMLQFSEETGSPTLYLAADLPSLKIEVDEHKIHTVLSCISSLKDSSSNASFPSATPTTTKKQEDLKRPDAYNITRSISASMYHSAIDSFLGPQEGVDQAPLDHAASDGILLSQAPVDRGWSQRKPSRYNSLTGQQKLLVAVERQVHAKLSIMEVQLSLSSKGRMITELKVPEVQLEFLKRPYDMSLQVLIQDLFVADRLQQLGPDYELIVCSSGRAYLGLSPSPSRAGKDEDHSTGVPLASDSGETEGSTHELLEDMDRKDALLTLRYDMLKPLSPRHPAVLEADKERDGEEGEDVKKKEESDIREPVIHRVNVQCTTLDAIANQETLIELVSFFKEVWPDSLEKVESEVSDTSDNEDQLIASRRQVPLQTEVKVSFDCLSVRMLKTVQSSRLVRTPTTPSASAKSSGTSRFFASIMLCGLTAEGKVSTDMSISGRIEGVYVKDVTPRGKNYPDILLVGNKKFEESSLWDEETPSSSQGPSTIIGDTTQFLSFSLDRSPHSSVSGGRGVPTHAQPGYKSDVHLSVFVPAIHYLHSVNFVYEMELFVIHLIKYFTIMSSSFKDAAVDVAKGLVGEKTKLTKGLSRLHSSFGHAQLSVAEETESSGIDETDAGLIVELSSSRFFFDVSIQSPVIVLPSSLQGEECLVAHLGEVKASNKYVCSSGQDTMLDSSLEESILVHARPPRTHVERMIFNVSNISLHATETRESRQKLEDSLTERSIPLHCHKVLKEASLSLQIEKHLKDGRSGSGGRGITGKDNESMAASSVLGMPSADLVVACKVCDPLTVQLPKKVFDQIRTTLRHGIRKEPRRRRNTEGTDSISSLGSARKTETKDKKPEGSKLGKSVHFHPNALSKSKKNHGFPKVCASFTLPKLSLELYHQIDLKDRDLVYVSLDDLSAKYQQDSLDYLSVDVSLRSILIEDLIQAEDSEYRNILSSSSNPFPFQPSSSPSASFIHNISGSAFTPSFSRHLYGFSHLMSTPRPQSASSTFSPLRSFNSDGPSSSSSVQNESEATLKVPECSQSDQHTDLLTIQAFFVGKSHPQFEKKYDSTSLHANVDFNSVFVIINLQTWVLLLDFLGIGVPTPPPSRSPSPDLTDPEPSSKTADKTTIAPDVPPVRTTSVDQKDSVSSHLRFPRSLVANSSSSFSQDVAMDGLLSEAPLPQQEKVSVWGVEGKLSLKCKLNVKSLTVTFNKQEHPLAKGNVSGVSAEVKLAEGNMEISGVLGQGSVLDMTETGAYYRERFTTTGEKALTFEIFKYGRPDPEMVRLFDIWAKVKMTSVRYLHTMRFLKEILAFISHFPQLIDAFQRMKANAQGKLDYAPGRKARISLNVTIDGPVLLIPKHAFSPEIMVGDIGHLSLSNSFNYDGSEHTITCMREKRRQQRQESLKSEGNTSSDVSYSTAPSTVEPRLMSPFDSRQSSPGSSSRSLGLAPHSMASLDPWSQSPSSASSIYASPKASLDAVELDRRRIEDFLETFKGPCLLDCIKLSLEDVDVFSAQRTPEFGDKFRILRQKGKVLKEKGTAKLFIERNLYEDFCRNVPDLHIEGTLQAIHVMLDKPQLELIKGLVEMNLGENIEDFEKPSTVIRDPVAQPMAAAVWTGFLFRMQFVEVQMEFLSRRQTEVQGSRDQSLARFDIQESEFTFESCSDQHKTVDLTSNAVIGYDTRYEGYEDQDKPSVFEEVLRPTFSLDKDTPKNILQVEIHVTIDPKEIKASILLNELRLVAILDVILELKNFIFDKIEETLEEDEDDIDSVSMRPSCVSPSLKQTLVSRLQLTKPEKKNPRSVKVKLSVTKTDFVVLEDITSLDSNAVVLKGTVILNFLSIPDEEKLLNCSIDSLELFSCNLSNEDETALSILDPVTVSLEIKPPERHMPTKSAKSNSIRIDEGKQIFEIAIQQLNFRLSYNDIKLFLAIAQSLPSMNHRSHTRPASQKQSTLKDVDDEILKRLLPLGFSKSDIIKEWNSTDSTSELAAILREYGEKKGRDILSESMEEADGPEEKKAFSIKYIQLHMASLSVCLIDDCVDNDVPLLDFSLADLQLDHALADETKHGKARAIFAGDYYNRHISAWEPVLESWTCELSWRLARNFSDVDSSNTSDRLQLKLTAKNLLNVNVTSSLIHILRLTQASWSRDLQHNQDQSSAGSVSSLSSSNTDFVRSHHRTASGKMAGTGDWESEEGGAEKKVSTMERGLALLHSVRFVSTTRQRSKFVPFLLRNNTGLPLMFATLTSVPSQVYRSHSDLFKKSRTAYGEAVVSRTSEWYEVAPGEEQPFDFTTRKKNRHRNTRELVVHQLLVTVSGWESISTPVSVDKIGVFFREVQPSKYTNIDLTCLPPSRKPIRLVFAISLDEVQKVVNVRSSLVLHNTMEIPLEIKLEPVWSYGEMSSRSESSSWTKPSPVVLPVLSPKGHLSIPLHLTSWNIFIRPQHWGVQYSNKHLSWKHITKGSSPTSHVRSCDAIGGEDLENPDVAMLPPFQFCVSVQRENYPPDSEASGGSGHSTSRTSSETRPAHTITIFPPLTITNLLPCDIQFALWSSTHRRKEAHSRRPLVSPGKDMAVYSVSLSSPLELDVAMEGFERCHGCSIASDRVGVPQSIVLEDYEGRPLRLSITTTMIGGGAIKVCVSCSYWLINRTGLPLVFKQEGMATEAAGQQSENEGASTTTPLLFAYSEGEFVEKCSMRLGRSFQGSYSGNPKWCAPFSMVSDCGVCRVFVRSTDNRPDQEFQIGVDISRGRGRYRDTNIVTFVAHYQLENRTQYKLAFLQRHQLKEEVKLQRQKDIPSIMPGAILPFHWPRTDLDQLLCLKVLDIQDSLWSGGFVLDKDCSFHLNIRSSYSYSAFIRCQVTLKRATFHIVFSDATKYPPPFRLENLSQTPIVCYQEGVRSSLALSLYPGQSVPYAWDEQTLPESMCVEVKSGGSVQLKLEQFGDKGKILYESYFYIVAFATFPSPEEAKNSGEARSAHMRKTGESSELVLDVPQGSAVIFQRRSPDRRSQLWRMSAAKKLVHIASSDEEPHVLDIAGGRLPGPGQYEPLVLRKSSTVRVHSQSWGFLSEGALVLDRYPGLCVQSRSGLESLREGADAVLGVLSQSSAHLPREQQICRKKHSPGSGVLSVGVWPDGPTRILRVTDQNKKYSHTRPRDDWIVVDNGQVAPSSSSDVDLSSLDNSEDEGSRSTLEVEVRLILEEGVGVSLINSVPEELIYGALRGVKVEFLSGSEVQTLGVNIQNIQVDNKLPSCFTPVMAYPTPTPSGDPTPSYPVLALKVERVLYQSPYGLIFKMADFHLQDMTVIVEERLLFKILQWAGIGQSSQSSSQGSGVKHEISDLISYRAVMPMSPSSLQVYFEQFGIAGMTLRMSVFTTSQLPEDLKAIKYHLGFPLVKFESPVKLRGFHQTHMIGDLGVYTDALVKHYKRVVKAQAIKILGSVDFLGNPVGLVSDVASGVSGMMSAQPDVVGLVRDVTHGMSDTTSKLTGTVSHVLGRATFDSSYQEEREQNLEGCQTSGDHLKAGLMGLSSGMFGGITSIVTQPIKDTRSYGFSGLFSGLAKGVVGTVAKPVAGLFDLASETSAAIRESTSRVSRQHPNPVRHTRCCLGANGALTSYSSQLAMGREYLLRITDGSLSEQLISYEKIREDPVSKTQMKVLISSQFLYFFQDSPPGSLHSQISLEELKECKATTIKTSVPIVYIVLSLFDKDSNYYTAKYQCSSEKIAVKVAQLVNYAKNLHEEEKHVVRTFRLQHGTVLW